ncbi:hypothetical protein [Shinella zoogloeoides]|uniref:Uncharacterized protein n=1 Tax=Shinella zoogloeoides TaxID=352475 RepID=A0A6N8TC35_SHIZO|nr:hypothetical protein [Shinella zoogloeoides]MXN98787.1 hypothetical protein [Shinella zoogloeoides]UEX83237.1 hypothetical protein K8M09_08210 [Shinella zoogloeoides]
MMNPLFYRPMNRYLYPRPAPRALSQVNPAALPTNRPLKLFCTVILVLNTMATYITVIGIADERWKASAARNR